MVALGPIHSWQPAAGTVTTWTASPAARESAARATRSDLPASFQQAAHLRGAFYGKALGRELPRLMVVAWDIPGVCDIALMTEAINAHLRRHDTYHSTFEVENGNIYRRVIDDPSEIDFVPASFGVMEPEQIRTHALATTAQTLQWDCFSFGVIQNDDHFTFYASVDHLHIDGMSAGLIFVDIHLMYQNLSQGQPVALPAVGGYADYTARQREKVAAMTLSSPEIKDWIDFAKSTDGDWPSFPLELGDTWASSKGDFVTVELLNEDDTEAFDTACREAGARFSGGVLACAALAEHQLTGNTTYHGFTPSDTRTADVDTMSVGWFASLFPVTVPIGDGEFAGIARAAQDSFNAGKYLANVPFERVLELASVDELRIKLPTKPGMMVSFLDFRKIPVAELWEQTGYGIYGDNLSHGGINMWINRHASRTTVTISFPDNPVARKSVHRYVAALSKAFADVAKITADWIEELAHHANSSTSCVVCASSR
ncbi:condensation domain-containing protein [Mycobacterium sp. 3519A]|uniref:condensation domain-containing protein n=1 Tax=Mycobacterium sp. 3519A TaxID=2057184 RepID=UPI000C79C2E2|nr:condensation domain-containing protein [Mycobacterium sp. 3519A]